MTKTHRTQVQTTVFPITARLFVSFFMRASWLFRVIRLLENHPTVDLHSSISGGQSGEMLLPQVGNKNINVISKITSGCTSLTTKIHPAKTLMIVSGEATFKLVSQGTSVQHREVQLQSSYLFKTMYLLQATEY